MHMTSRKLEKLLKTVANRRRLDIVRVLSQQKSSSVIDLANRLRLSFYSTSKHLQILRQEGFITGEQAGKSIEYRLDDDLSVGHKQILNFVVK